MPTSYTDVDRLILERWDDTRGLLDAYEELQDRIHDVISEVGERLADWAAPQAYVVDTDPKLPSFFVYRNTWMNRRRDDGLVYFELTDFAPLGYRRVKENHPSVWIWVDQLQMLRMKEPERVQFSRDLRGNIGDLANQWKHEECNDAECPLGRQFVDVSDIDRRHLIADPDKLFEFATDALKSVFVLSDAIEKTLVAAKAKE